MKFPIFATLQNAPSSAVTQHTQLYASKPSTGSEWISSTSSGHAIGSGGTITAWAIDLRTAPGSGKSWVFEVYKNGSATGFSITISDTATTGSTTGSLSFSALDSLIVVSTPSGTPTAPSSPFSWAFEATATNQLILGTAYATSSTTHYNNPFRGDTGGSGGSTTVEGDASVIVPVGGTLKNLFIQSSAAGTSRSKTLTLYKNGSSTSLAVTLSGSGSGDGITYSSDTTDTVSVVAGDTISLEYAPTNSPFVGTSYTTLEFEPTVAGDSFTSFATESSPSISSTDYNFFSGAGASSSATWSGTSSSRTHIVGGFYAKALAVSLRVAPGSGKSRTYTVMDNTTDTDIDVVISGTSTSGVGTGSQLYALGDKANVKTVPSGTPTSDSGSSISVAFNENFTNDLTPTPASLTLSTFAPSVTTTNNITVTPSTASLITSLFAPTVSGTSEHTLSTDLIEFIFGANNITLTPVTTTLTTSTLAPTVSISDNQFATPDTASLTLSPLAPTVSATNNISVTPDTATLTTTTFIPTVATSNNQVFTPDPASLTITTFAPSVDTTENRFVTPDTISLTTTTYAPIVFASDNKSVTPDVASLTLSTFAPTVEAGQDVTVTPTTASMVLTGFDPTVSLSQNTTVTPATAQLRLRAAGRPIINGEAYCPQLLFDEDGNAYYRIEDELLVRL